MALVNGVARAGCVTAPEAMAERIRIAEGLKRQDAGLIHELIDRYQHRLMRYLSSLTGRRDLAEDLFQETWMRVLERGHLYDDRGDFDAWLFTIARNRALDYFRKKPVASLDEMMHPDEDGSAVFDPVAMEPSPLEQFGQSEQASAMRTVIGRLQPIHQEVLRLYFFEDLTMREIAERTGIHMPTVKSRLYRAIGFCEEFLRESLTDPRTQMAAMLR